MPILSDGFDNSLSGGGVSGYKDLSVKIFPRRVCLKSVTMFNISGEFFGMAWIISSGFHLLDMFGDTILKIGMASVCPSILFGFTYCNAFASSWWVVGAGMSIGLFVCRFDMCGNVEFIVVKVDIGV